MRNPVVATAITSGNKKCVDLKTNGNNVSWLIDSGSDLSIIDLSLAKSLGVKSYNITTQKASATSNSTFELNKNAI